MTGEAVRSSSGAGSKSRRVGDAGARAWRVVASLAVLVTVVTTHWPRLVFSAEAPSDKVLHALAFGVLTFLVWQARWFGSLRMLILAMIAFSAVDERTQSLPLFNRHTSMDDWIADLFGVLLVAMMIWLNPRPRSAVARMRFALVDSADRAMFDRPFAWLAMATSAIVGAMAGCLLGIGQEKWLLDSERPLQTMLLAAVLLAALAVAITWRSGRRANVSRIIRNRCCFECGESIATRESGDNHDSGACPHCSAGWSDCQWTPPAPRGGLGGKSSARDYLLAGALIGIMWAVAAAMPSFIARFSWWNAPSKDMRQLYFMALSLLALLLAMRPMVLGAWRSREREGSRCLGCGHDLTGASTKSRVGCCSECALPFVRID